MLEYTRLLKYFCRYHKLLLSGIKGMAEQENTCGKETLWGATAQLMTNVSLTLWSYGLNHRFSTQTYRARIYAGFAQPLLVRLCCPSHASLV